MNVQTRCTASAVRTLQCSSYNTANGQAISISGQVSPARELTPLDVCLRAILSPRHMRYDTNWTNAAQTPRYLLPFSAQLVHLTLFRRRSCHLTLFRSWSNLVDIFAGKHRAIMQATRVHSNYARCSKLAGRVNCTRRTVKVFAFQHETGVSIPLDYYKCLGITRAASKDAVRKAYDRVVRSPPEVGYSEDVLFSRALILKDAADCLLDLDSRKAYENLAHQSGQAVSVAPDNVPGMPAKQSCMYIVNLQG